MRDMFIKFRGEDDVLIGYHVDASGPGSGVCVEWWFKDLPFRSFRNMTEPEEEEIRQAVISHWDDGKDGEP